MKRKKIFSVVAVSFFSLFIVAGVVAAATEWPGDNTFTGTVNQFEKGIKIGKQGTGGVTFFNGTIVNATTNDGVDNPVAFGDNVRIDGELWRGEKAGPGDMPVKVNDDLTVAGEITGMTPAGAMGSAPAPVKIAGGLNVDGNVVVDNGGFTFVQPQKLSIPAAAFTPSRHDEGDAIDTDNQGYWLKNLNTDSERLFVAPFTLPKGVTISKATMYYALGQTAAIEDKVEASLGYHEHGDIAVPPAKGLWMGTFVGTKANTSVNLNGGTELKIKDNRSYYVHLTMPRTDVPYSDGRFYEIVLEYN